MWDLTVSVPDHCLSLYSTEAYHSLCPSLDYISITGFLFANFQTLSSNVSCKSLMDISV